jgi:hypothetical protein
MLDELHNGGDSDVPPFHRRSRRSALVVLHLIPAGLVGALMLGLVDGLIGAVIGFVSLLVVPGWLLWKILQGPITTEPLALPALWLVFSFALLSPAVAPMVFFGGPALAVEWYALAVLVVLGVAGSRVSNPRIEPLGTAGIAVAAVGGIAMVYRALTWHSDGDSLTFLGYLRATAMGSYPSTNPFFATDLPVNPRWRFSGWSGVTGVLSHLGDADPQQILQTVLPVLMIIFAASALYLLAQTLTGDRWLAEAAALATMIVPLITGNTGKTDFVFTYQDIGQDKFTALLIFVPALSAMLVGFYRSRRRSTGILVSLVLWASLFTHAVVVIMGVAIFLAFVVIDRLVTRPPKWRSAAGWSLVVIAPLVVTAALASLVGTRQGTVAGDVNQLSDFAEPRYQIGSIQLWVPNPMTPGELREAEPEDAAAVFSRGYAATTEGPAVVFLSNGWPLAHPGVLQNGRYLLLAFALLVIVVGRYHDGLALWIVGSTATALSVYVLPPVAAIAARLVTPWQLYRFAWLIPVPLAVAWLVSKARTATKWGLPLGLAIGLLLGLVFAWSSHSTLLRTGPAPARDRLTASVEQLEGRDGIILAPNDLVIAAVSRWHDLKAFSFRGYSSMSNAFPVSRQGEALERFRDARIFFRKLSTDERLTILSRYDVRYVAIQGDDSDQIDVDALGLRFIEEIGRDYVLYEWHGDA